MVLEIKEGLHASYTSTLPLTYNPSPWSFGFLLKIYFIFNPLPALPCVRGKGGWELDLSTLKWAPGTELRPAGLEASTFSH